MIVAIAVQPSPACEAQVIYRTPDAQGDAPIGLKVAFNGDPLQSATLAGESTVGTSGPLASFFSEVAVTDLVTPDALIGREAVKAQTWLVLAPPGVTGADFLANETSGTWTQIGGLSIDNIDRVSSFQQQIYGVGALALAAALMGLIVFSFDNYTERYRMSQRWLRFGLPERVGSRSYLVGQVVSGLTAAVLGCVTGVAIAWDLGYTTVASVVVGSRTVPIVTTVVACVVIVLLNAATMAAGVRLVKDR
jgi:hypothetical protein